MRGGVSRLGRGLLHSGGLRILLLILVVAAPIALMVVGYILLLLQVKDLKLLAEDTFAEIDKIQTKLAEQVATMHGIQTGVEQVTNSLDTLHSRAIAADEKLQTMTNLVRSFESQSHTFGNLYLGDGIVSCYVAPLGIWMMLESVDKGITPHLCHGFGWEPSVTAVFERTIKPGMYAVDAGANIGWFTTLLAKMVGPDGRVMAIEAQPRTFDLLSTTLELNGMLSNVKSVNKAVYDSDGKYVEIRYMPERSLSNHIVPDGVTLDAAASTHVVKTVMLDTLLREWDRVDFLKIDVQGDEPAVFAGMQTVLDRNPAIIVFLEVNTERLERAKPGAAKAFFRKLALRFRTIKYIRDDGLIEAITVDELANATRDFVLYLQRTDVHAGAAGFTSS